LLQWFNYANCFPTKINFNVNSLEKLNYFLQNKIIKNKNLKQLEIILNKKYFFKLRYAKSFFKKKKNEFENTK